MSTFPVHSALPLPARTANAQPIPILTYHQVDTPGPRGTPYRSLCVAPADFERQMQWLALLGYRGLSLPALLPYLRGEQQGRVVGITLDDGYVNNLRHAAPVLARHGFTATCYMVSGLMGQTNVWDATKGVPPAALMTAADLREWRSLGFDVGAHTRTHCHLPELEAQAARREVQDSRAELQDALGAEVEHFCYPYGDTTPQVAALVREAGFASATTTQRSRCATGEDWWSLPRVPVLRSTGRLQLWLKLATRYEDRRRQ